MCIEVIVCNVSVVFLRHSVVGTHTVTYTDHPTDVLATTGLGKLQKNVNINLYKYTYGTV